MNKIYIALLILLTCNVTLAQYGSSKKPTCNEVISYAKKNYDSKDSPMIISSTMLAKIERYKVGSSSVVVAYIKKNDYDLYGSPYIFCGISDQRWSSFKNGGLYGSWGKSFHQYIIDYTCDCE